MQLIGNLQCYTCEYGIIYGNKSKSECLNVKDKTNCPYYEEAELHKRQVNDEKRIRE